MTVIFIIFRFDHIGEEEMIQTHTIFRKIRHQDPVKFIGYHLQLFIDLKNTDPFFTDQFHHVRLHFCHQKRTHLLHKLRMRKLSFRADDLNEKFSAVFHRKIHFPARTKLNGELIGGFHKFHSGIRTPFDRHLFRFVDKIQFTMKWSGVTRQTIEKFGHKRKILSFQRVSAGTE